MVPAELAEPLHLIALTLFVFAVPWLRRAYVPVPERDGVVQASIPQTTPTGRFTVFDVLKGVAILAVVIIHVTYLWPGPSRAFKTFLLAVDASMRFALPIFFITSGILLIPERVHKEGVLRWYANKTAALGIPYVIVAAVAAYLAGMGLEAYIRGLVTGSISVPYYFLIILFQLYLLYPMLVPLARHRIFVYGALFFSIAWQLSPYWHVFDIPLGFRFMGFFVWGMYLRAQLFDGTLGRDLRPWALLVVLAVTLYALLPGQYYNMRPYYGVGMCMLLYGAYLQGWFAPTLERLLSWVGQRTLWIYLTHYLILMPLVPWFASNTAPFVGTLGGFTVATVVSLVVCPLVGGFLQDGYGWVLGEVRRVLPYGQHPRHQKRI